MRALRPPHHPIAWIGAALSVSVVALLAVHGWWALQSGYYLSPVSGVWLSFARDAADGVLYRPLIGPLGYGGSRYAPAFFVAIAALMKAGLPPLIAAGTVQVVAVVLLWTGVAAGLRACAVPWWRAAMASSLAVAPYFVHATLFEIRADILAAAFTVWGLAFTARLLSASDRLTLVLAAAACFTLGVTTKITAIAAPLAAMIALTLAGRRRAALQTLVAFVVLSALVASVTLIASQGRVIESFQAFAFSEQSAADTVRSMFVYGPRLLFADAGILSALFAAFVAAMAIDFRRSWRDPFVIFTLLSVVTTTFVLGSPGTVRQNQIIELYVAAVLALTACLRRTFVTEVGCLSMAILMVLSMRHVVRDMTAWRLREAATTMPVERQALIEAVGGFLQPVLSESAVLPVLAGSPAFMADPYAYRVISKSHPELERDLIDRLRQHAFAYVVLERDPLSPEGADVYRDVHFGQNTIAAILENYRLDRAVGGRWIYAPR